MTPIRTGVVGVGHLGYHHARNYAALEGAELVGVVDPHEANRDKAANDLTVPAFSDVKGLIAAGVDAVSVATPTTTHSEVVNELLQAGIHVLVEKPIAPTLHEAETMVALAKTHKCLLQVGRGTDVSVVLDLMIHDLDIILAMEKSEVVSLDAVGVPVFSESEDIANVRIRFESGCVANLTCSRVSLDRMRKIRIFESNAYLSTDYSAQEVLVYRKKPGPIPEGSNPMEHITMEPLPVEKDEPLKLELRSFVECVREGRRPIVSGEDGVKALRLAQDIMDFIRRHA